MGIFEDIEDRKNVSYYKPLTEDQLLEAMEEASKKIQTPDRRQLRVITGSAGVDAIEKAKYDYMTHQRRLHAVQLYMDKLYGICVRKGMRLERADKLSNMLSSKDDEAYNMAKQIIDNYGK